MKSQVLQYIRELTARDPKSLTAKALKTAEEVGELAKKTLSHENAFATTHRIVEKRDVLEECADGILCLLSIAYDLGFEDADIEEMMHRKAQKWDSLQTREAGVKYPVPFECHVTVKQANKDAFMTACASLGVKPIVLALQDRSGATVLNDVMTSSVHLGTNRSALEEVDRIAAGLVNAGFDVVRRKIESVPWHPAAPSDKNGVSAMPPGGYFESHLNIVVEAKGDQEMQARRALLKSLADRHDAHLSRNVFKQLSDTVFTIMLTLRRYDGTREIFEDQRDALAKDVQEHGFALEKLITEFSIFDSASQHDASWLKVS